MSKYTPGPWTTHVQKSGPTSWNEGLFVHIASAAGPLIADFDASYAEFPDEAAVRANVRLMATAPELLEALILLVRTHEEPAETLLQEAREQRWLEQAQAAIAKALGTA